jgi:hypothetical protein
MALSQDLITQFAKLTVEPKDTNKAEIVKGTYKKVGDIEYVQIDGSEIWTPVKSTVNATAGDKVKVEIKNHIATITGNITNPSASSREVDTLADTVDEHGNTIKQMNNTITQQGSSILTIDSTLNQVESTVNEYKAIVDIQETAIQAHDSAIRANTANIAINSSDIRSQGDDISSLNTTVRSQNTTINTMNDNIRSQGNQITAINNTVVSQGNTIIQQGNTISEHDTQITTDHANIVILNSGFTIENGVLTGLSQIVLDTLTSKYADIDFANIDIAAIATLFTESGIIKDLVVDDQHITGELVGVTIKGDLIEGNTVKADKLVIKGSNGLYYKLNVTGEKLEAEQTDENSLNGSVITAKSITASKISVEDLVAFDATIGGFHISESSIYSGAKGEATSTNPGIYMDSNGQINFGNDTDYLKFIYDSKNDKWNLDISASTIKFGADNTTLEAAFGQIEQTITNNENEMKAVMRYTVEQGAGVLTIGTINTDSDINYYTKIDNDEIRFVSIDNNDVETTIAQMTNHSLSIDSISANNDLTIGNKFRFRNLVNNGMILEKI